MATGDSTMHDSTAAHSSGVDDAAGQRLWTLSVAHHPEPAHVGLRLALPEGTDLVLGREADCFGAGVLEDARISRAHVRVTVEAGRGARIHDLGSRNGTHLNGHQITDTAVLRNGDVLRLGSILLLVHKAPSAYAPAQHASLVGVSHTIARVIESIEKVGARDTTVLVLGETGTGKEVVARAIHDASGRTGKFCAINCGGIPEGLLQAELFGHVRGAFSGAERDREGLIEAAAGGTLFLDEIGDASPALQLSLLRFLQEGEVRRVGSNQDIKVDTRVIAATHRDLKSFGGAFRQDLYGRLARWIIELPPLRKRVEDIPHLLAHFVRRYAGDDRPVHWKLSLHVLRQRWQRNVRELELFVERALIEAGDEVPVRVPPARPMDSLQRSIELSQADGPEQTPEMRQRETPPIRKPPRSERPGHDELRELLVAHDGNVTALAEQLGVGRNTLYRWIKAAGIDLDDFRSVD